MNPFDFEKFEENVRQMKDALGIAQKYAISKFKNVSNEVFEKRKLICEKCVFWDKDGWFGAGKCKKCGCSGKKLLIPFAECPIQKWSKEIDIA